MISKGIVQTFIFPNIIQNGLSQEMHALFNNINLTKQYAHFTKCNVVYTLNNFRSHDKKSRAATSTFWERCGFMKRYNLKF